MEEIWQTQQDDEYIGCSIGIMAYNEEIIVVASGCTDRTVLIVAEIALQDPRVRLCIQEKREGKASAINLFLKQATSPVLVLIGADVIPEESAIENLCSPFKDPKVGMVDRKS